ncbi:MAG: hypothetical protein JKY34_08710 [Kordiimonadaceae bacterium]|nr:hypothetical protein [Kordiimonadaceae bacterium]
MILAGLLTAVGALLLCFKLGIRKCLYFDVPLDIVVTLGTAWFMGGTYSGVMAAIVAGVAFSVTLYIVKFFTGYERLTASGWVPVPGSISVKRD